MDIKNAPCTLQNYKEFSKLLNNYFYVILSRKKDRDETIGIEGPIKSVLTYRRLKKYDKQTGNLIEQDQLFQDEQFSQIQKFMEALINTINSSKQKYIIEDTIEKDITANQNYTQILYNIKELLSDNKEPFIDFIVKLITNEDDKFIKQNTDMTKSVIDFYTPFLQHFDIDDFKKLCNSFLEIAQCEDVNLENTDLITDITNIQEKIKHVKNPRFIQKITNMFTKKFTYEKTIKDIKEIQVLFFLAISKLYQGVLLYDISVSEEKIRVNLNSITKEIMGIDKKIMGINKDINDKLTQLIKEINDVTDFICGGEQQDDKASVETLEKYMRIINDPNSQEEDHKFKKFLREKTTRREAAETQEASEREAKAETEATNIMENIKGLIVSIQNEKNIEEQKTLETDLKVSEDELVHFDKTQLSGKVSIEVNKMVADIEKKRKRAVAAYAAADAADAAARRREAETEATKIMENIKGLIVSIQNERNIEELKRLKTNLKVSEDELVHFDKTQLSGKVSIEVNKMVADIEKMRKRAVAADAAADAAARRHEEGPQVHIGGFKQQNIHQYIRDNNLAIKQEAADGNCLYRAMADFILQDPDRYQEIKDNIFNYMERDIDAVFEKIKGFLSDELEKMVNETKERIFTLAILQEYINKKRVDNVWGDQIEIIYFSKAYETDVLIFYNDNTIQYFSAEGKSEDEAQLPEIIKNPDVLKLYYVDRTHYDYITNSADVAENEKSYINNIIGNSNVIINEYKLEEVENIKKLLLILEYLTTHSTENNELLLAILLCIILTLLVNILPQLSNYMSDAAKLISNTIKDDDETIKNIIFQEIKNFDEETTLAPDTKMRIVEMTNRIISIKNPYIYNHMNLITNMTNKIINIKDECLVECQHFILMYPSEVNIESILTNSGSINNGIFKSYAGLLIERYSLIIEAKRSTGIEIVTNHIKKEPQPEQKKKEEQKKEKKKGSNVVSLSDLAQQREMRKTIKENNMIDDRAIVSNKRLIDYGKNYDNFKDYENFLFIFNIDNNEYNPYSNKEILHKLCNSFYPQIGDIVLFDNFQNYFEITNIVTKDLKNPNNKDKKQLTDAATKAAALAARTAYGSAAGFAVNIVGETINTVTQATEDITESVEEYTLQNKFISSNDTNKKNTKDEEIKTTDDKKITIVYKGTLKTINGYLINLNDTEKYVNNKDKIEPELKKIKDLLQDKFSSQVPDHLIQYLDKKPPIPNLLNYLFNKIQYDPDYKNKDDLSKNVYKEIFVILMNNLFQENNNDNIFDLANIEINLLTSKCKVRNILTNEEKNNLNIFTNPQHNIILSRNETNELNNLNYNISIYYNEIIKYILIYFKNNIISLPFVADKEIHHFNILNKLVETYSIMNKDEKLNSLLLRKNITGTFNKYFKMVSKIANNLNNNPILSKILQVKQTDVKNELNKINELNKSDDLKNEEMCNILNLKTNFLKFTHINKRDILKKSPFLTNTLNETIKNFYPIKPNDNKEIQICDEKKNEYSIRLIRDKKFHINNINYKIYTTFVTTKDETQCYCLDFIYKMGTTELILINIIIYYLEKKDIENNYLKVIEAAEAIAEAAKAEAAKAAKEGKAAAKAAEIKAAAKAAEIKAEGKAEEKGFYCILDNKNEYLNHETFCDEVSFKKKAEAEAAKAEKAEAEKEKAKKAEAEAKEGEAEAKKEALEAKKAEAEGAKLAQAAEEAAQAEAVAQAEAAKAELIEAIFYLPIQEEDKLDSRQFNEKLATFKHMSDNNGNEDFNNIINKINEIIKNTELNNEKKKDQIDVQIDLIKKYRGKGIFGGGNLNRKYHNRKKNTKKKKTKNKPIKFYKTKNKKLIKINKTKKLKNKYKKKYKHFNTKKN